ncbi:MAG: lamin tail domain-containing protein [Phycisphaerales bacterium]
MIKSFAVLSIAALATAAHAQVRITEWMYNGNDGEYIEITNTGASPVSMVGWSFDDNSQAFGSFALDSLGTLQPGQSAIITEIAAADFRTNWGLSASVPVIGLNGQNLGRSDEMNIYNGSTLVDRLTYNDQGAFPVNGPRTQNVSGNTLPSNWGANNANGWFLSSVGDAYGSRTGLNGDIGNPGIVLPTPGAAALLGLGGLIVGRRR